MVLQERQQRDIEAPNSQNNLAAVRASEAVLGIAAATTGARETLRNGAIPFSILAIASHLIQGQPILEGALKWQGRILSTVSDLLWIPHINWNISHGKPLFDPKPLGDLAYYLQQPTGMLRDYLLTRTPVIGNILDAQMFANRNLFEVIAHRIGPDMAIGGFAVTSLALISWARVGRRMLGVLNRGRQ
ncbi:MAG: hypothetical protein M1120_02555 [Patescibacteria group bacterium]|nr:hypothetical protein [Patescibacteria group bacterium]